MLYWYGCLLDGYSILYQHLSRFVILKSIHLTWELFVILYCTIRDITVLSKLLPSLWHFFIMGFHNWWSVETSCVFKVLPICIGSWELLYLYTWKFCKRRFYDVHIMNQFSVMWVEWVMCAILWSFGEGETT